MYQVATYYHVPGVMALERYWLIIITTIYIYCKRIYFRAAKFSRIKPYGAYSRFLIFVHMPFNSIFFIMIIIFAHIKFSRIYGPVRNARRYVLRENFYVHSICKVIQ